MKPYSTTNKWYKRKLMIHHIIFYWYYNRVECQYKWFTLYDSISLLNEHQKELTKKYMAIMECYDEYRKENPTRTCAALSSKDNAPH